MKKSFLILLSFVLSAISGYSQDKQRVPVLFDTIGKPPGQLQGKNIELAIPDPTLKDTLKGFINVVIAFEAPLCDTTKKVKVRSINLYSLIICDKNGDMIVETSPLKSKITKQDQHFMDLCEPMIKYWYKDQPYGRMLGRDEFTTKVKLVAPVDFVPVK